MRLLEKLTTFYINVILLLLWGHLEGIKILGQKFTIYTLEMYGLRKVT